MTNALSLVVVPADGQYDIEGAIAQLKPLPRGKAAKAKATVKPVNCAPKAAKLPTSEQLDEFRFSAFNASINRRRMAANLLKVLGVSPAVEAFDLATGALREGYVAGALAKRVNVDLTVVETRKLFARASTLVNQFASFTSKSVPEGKLGRRNETEEKACKSAASSISQLLALVGIVNPHKETNGGGSSADTRKPRQPVANNDTAPAVEAAPVAEVVLGKGKSFAELLAYYSTQAKAMSRTYNNNVKAKPEREGDMLKLAALVGDFAAGIAKLNAK